MSLLKSVFSVSFRKSVRGFSSSSTRLVASNFGMPAMSPTMTEGGIVDWKFKEGEPFNSGDVLLEIETDKAQIDVEAQDDGILAKIYIPSGTTGIPVGKTIAVLAEADDDLSTLEIPKPEEGALATAEPTAPAATLPPKPSPAELKPVASASAGSINSSSESVTAKADPGQILLPSVLSLALDNNLTKEDVIEKVLASGPKGRVTKGDILAYLGKVPRGDVDSLVTSIQKLQHLDLSKVIIKPQPVERAAVSSAPVQKPDTKSASSQTPPASTSSAVLPAAPPNPPKPKPIVLSGIFTLADINYLQDGVAANIGSSISTKSLIEKASKYALRDSHKLFATKQSKSVFFDPIFEDIIAPSALGQPPFVVSIKYPRSSTPSLALKHDSYDDFLGTPKSPKATAAIGTSELLSVDVTINNKYPGATDKAKIYLDRLGFYLSQGKGELLL